MQTKVPRGHRMSPLNHEPAMVLYARKSAKMTQAEAVEHLRPLINSKGYLSEIEKGTRSASRALLERMAQVYDVPFVGLIRKQWSA
jgi:transcriptional regulator with XRE-family HTH domain